MQAEAENRSTRSLAEVLLPRSDVDSSVWLWHLRWVAVAGQLLTISVASYYFNSAVPTSPLLVLVGVTAATNVVFGLWLREETRRREEAVQQTKEKPAARLPNQPAVREARVMGVLMGLDLITLTGMLHFSGGIDNPFSSFFFVNLAVAGITLRPRWAWILTFISIIGFIFLLFMHVPLLDVLHSHESDPQARTRHAGGLVAFIASATVITFFVTGIATELARQQNQLREAEKQQARGRQLDALSTLAAGAAHELATPMSTVVLIAKELQRHLEDVPVPDSVRNDLQLIDSELRHCRSILSRMRSAAGDHAGEQWEKSSVGELIDIVLEGIREPHRVEIEELEPLVEEAELWLPREAVAQAIRNLIHNGLDASPSQSFVDVGININDTTVTFSIHDQGEGMDPETLQRIGQPFFTTKEPGRGMGLGLFLTRNVIQRLGGTLQFESELGRGTTAKIQLPRTVSAKSSFDTLSHPS